MSPGGPEKLNLTSFFTPENILVCKQKLKTDEIICDLLKNLALTYGIGNVKQILNGYMRKNGSLAPIKLNNSALVQHCPQRMISGKPWPSFLTEWILWLIINQPKYISCFW